jgi:hypothetical protein
MPKELPPPTSSELFDNPSDFVDNPTELVVNTAIRCGISEVDAREHCRSTCTTGSECPFAMTCIPVHENLSASTSIQRLALTHCCGPSEIHSRTFSGAPCDWTTDCAKGEECHGLHANFCGSLYTRRAL